jgi:transposase
MSRNDLTNFKWRVIKPLLPNKAERVLSMRVGTKSPCDRLTPIIGMKNRSAGAAG